jgi:hypothetical protein
VPNRIFGSSSANRAWPISATSQPPPSADPASSETTGLPSVSSLRKLAFIASMAANDAAASSSFSVSSVFSAAPAKKVDFADASSTPLIRSLSATACAAASARSRCHSGVIVLTGEPGASKVIVAMPPASSS